MIIFKQRVWNIPQKKPFITFVSLIATFSLTNSTFEKAIISKDGVLVKNSYDLTFSGNKFLNISGTTGFETMVHLLNVRATEERSGYGLVKNRFIGIG
jgi:hypothetical protein